MEIKVPEVGESVREALLAKWYRKSGEIVKKDQLLCEIETDKITLDLHASSGGLLTVKVDEGVMIPVGTVIAEVDENAAQDDKPLPESASSHGKQLRYEESVMETLSSPSVRRDIREAGLDPRQIRGSGDGGRITHDDLTVLKSADESVTRNSGESPLLSREPIDIVSVRSEEPPAYGIGRGEERKPMSPLRKRISERLVMARQQTAMLTTFNEADISAVKKLREISKGDFARRHGSALGFMPFFVRASVEALKTFPHVNASIDGDDIVIHNYFDIGVAIGGEKGLVVPVIRNAERMTLRQIDQAISEFSGKIKSNRLEISDLEGGTFTISNGGVYGSMFSTPIINPPQSAVLGMHAIEDRPVVRDGGIDIRPMMYLALSYDHRIIDGREAVGFLKLVKEYIEEPETMLLEG